MTLTEPETSAFRWDRVTASSALAYCVLAAAISIGLVLGELRSQLHLNGTVTALHGSTFGLGMILAGAFGSRVVARFGRLRVFWTASTAVVAGVVLFCVGHIVAVTLLGATLSGFSAAAIVMVQPGLIADHHGPHRSAAFAAVNAYPPLCGVTIALVIGVALSRGVSWRVAFVTFTLLLFALLVGVGRKASIPRSTASNPEPLRALFRTAAVRRAWRDLALAVMTEFPIGIWGTVYLKEVGHSSAALAPVLASTFGLCLFGCRLLIPRLQSLFGSSLGDWSIAATGAGALVLWMVPSLPGKVAALAIIGFSAGPLYSTSVDRLYAVAPTMDTNAIGSLAALASGVAVSSSPLALGVLADIVGLRRAILIVPVLAAIALWFRRSSRAADRAAVVAFNDAR